jgi:hypothetical protein
MLSIRRRKAVGKLVINVAIICEPLRLKIRGNSLARALATQPGTKATANDSPPLLVLMVYRVRNLQLVQVFLRELNVDADVRLWALDEVAPELSDVTLGCGPGLRFTHLNWLYGAKSIEEGSWVVLTDDDFLFTKGGLTQTISLMKRAGFSFAQPGQSILGWWTSLFNVARPFSMARDTNYVEQGPLVIADPAFASQILPFPEDGDMGWGIEAQWYRIKEGRFRIGVIDACRLSHWGQNATSYEAEPEIERMNERLSNSGIVSLWQLQSVNERWWKWQRNPPWKRT